MHGSRASSRDRQGREYETEVVSANSTLWVMGGMCGIVGVDVRAGHGGGRPSCMNDPSCRISFDESGDDEEEQSDEDSEDHDPRRSKRARQGVDKLGRNVAKMWTRLNFA